MKKTFFLIALVIVALITAWYFTVPEVTSNEAKLKDTGASIQSYFQPLVYLLCGIGGFLAVAGITRWTRKKIKS